MPEPTALQVADQYHRAWVGRDFDTVDRLLAPGLVVEVPMNDYPTKASFVAAVAAFSAMTRRVTMLDRFGTDATAIQLYDMDVEGFGTLRVAEHFTVEAGAITRVRHVHDTHALRQAGFGGQTTPVAPQSAD
jgi:hypothetical protein